MLENYDFMLENQVFSILKLSLTTVKIPIIDLVPTHGQSEWVRGH